jgi:hypothetical protein
MNEELEKMIRFATEDGSITDKEREIILRKAQEVGADLDEVEIMLESELAKHDRIVESPKPAIQRPKEKVKKCPNCGATITESILTCPECGYDFSMQSETSEEFQKRIEQLKIDLIRADEEYIKETESLPWYSPLKIEKEKYCINKKANIIKSFNIPITKEGLMQLLDYTYSNYYATINEDDYYSEKDKIIHKAWESKYMQTYNMLKRHALSDTQVQAFIYSHDEQVRGRNKEKEIKKKNKKHEANKGLIGWTFFMVLLFIIMGIMAYLEEKNISLVDLIDSIIK